MNDLAPARAAAFSPGHVTGFFEIHDEHADPARRGSRGAGFALSHGAVSYVEVEPAESLSVRIAVDKTETEAPVTHDAAIRILKEAVARGKVALNKEAPKGQRARVAVRIHTELQLPVSQGFGMSAAGALSASLALARALRMGRSEAVLAAHCADATQHGGLGDVVGALQGGFETRLAPGVPPYGHVTNFLGYGEAVLCVMEGPLETKSILTDPARRAAVNAAGKRAMDVFLQAPSMDAFLDGSLRFARESGLLTPRLAQGIEACRPHGKASMSMLGHSLFAFGNTPRLVDALTPFGEVRIVPIAEAGARLLDIEA